MHRHHCGGMVKLNEGSLTGMDGLVTFSTFSLKVANGVNVVVIHSINIGLKLVMTLALLEKQNFNVKPFCVELGK